MDNNKDHTPMELKPEFLEALENIARQDDEGTLEHIPHETLMAELDQSFASIERSIATFEADNPEYAPTAMPKLARG